MSFRKKMPWEAWEWESERRQICLQLRIPYPPLPEPTYRIMMVSKQEAEIHLKNGMYEQALIFYTNGLKCVQLFPGLPQFAEEHYKLLCNRSLVFTKLGDFMQAEEDAHRAASLNPNFVKAYWRIANAVKGYFGRPDRVIIFILQGLQKSVQGHGTTRDIVDFLTELCTLIPQTSSTGVLNHQLRDLGPITSEIDNTVWVKVLLKLATSNSWQSLAMLILGKHRGPSSILDGIAHGVSCAGISVASLLSSVSIESMKAWGEALAVALIKQGASVDDIGYKMNKPTVHVATEKALTMGKLMLLECVLEHYKDKPDKKNAVNANGSTALHLLVRSGQASTTHGLAVLQLLLKFKLNTTMEDKDKKIPLSYLGQEEKAYVILKKATKSVEELRHDLEDLKTKGNAALKAGKLADSLAFWEEALDISQQSKLLYKEAAILYSNRANVFFRQQEYTEALTNALAAISCDSSYHKGHWWSGKIFMAMNSFSDAYQAFIDGCTKSSINTEVQLSFIMEAVVLLRQLPSEKFLSCYGQLPFLNSDHWPQVLGKLSANCEWKIMAYLILGPDLEKKELKRTFTAETVKPVCTGVAKSASLRYIQMRTVFKYLEDKPLKQCLPWLDALVTVLYYMGGPDVFQTLALNDGIDTALHAVIRYSLITGSFTLIEQLPEYNPVEIGNLVVDGHGNSLFHTATKMKPPPPAKNMEKVVQLLLDKGFSAMDRDRHGQLAVEFLDKNYPGSLFDMFFKASGAEKNLAHKVDSINNLKEMGNQYFKRGDYFGALDCYREAIAALEMSSPHNVNQMVTSRDRAMLYGNRAEAFMKINMWNEALEDAKRSVSVDGHWYKGHLRVGKALRALIEPEGAMRAFINAYKDAGQEVTVKLEIVMELCELMNNPVFVRRFDLNKKLPGFPSHEGHIWAQAVLKLTADNRWDMAQHAYHQYLAGNPRKPYFNGSVQSLCNITKLKHYTWGVDMVQYFLDCGADRSTVTIEKGDTYMHAAVRMDLVTGKATKFMEYMLKKFCGRGSREHHALDHHGNTMLHIAARETGQNINPQNRQRLITLLLRHDLDPNIKNKDGKLAIDYVPQPENQSKETLRMAMYGKENMPKYTVAKPPSKGAQTTSRQDQAQAARESKPAMPQGCDNCEKMLSEAEGYLAEEHTAEGYQTLAELFKQSHKGARHEQILKRAIKLFEVKLGESDYPEIPNCLTEIRKDFYLQIVEGLASRGKWRQMDALVRKYRAMKGSDQLKGFAAGMSVVPVISDSSLKAAEDIKLQIVTNLLSSGATFGSDNGVRAIQCAQHEDHYKVVVKLIRDGANTSSLTMAIGDTPIHAALTIVLEKEKVPSLLEFLLDQYKSDPEKYQHLDPEQLDDNGDCLFHILAKAKHNSTVIKVTEMLCKRNLSGHYFNKEGKLPIHYIVKKNDRRQQYLKLADGVKPSREQSFQRESGHQEVTALDDEDLQQFSRSTDQHEIHEITEVNRTHSVYETRKRNISELIRTLPESKSSLFGRGENISAKTSAEDFDDNDSGTAGSSSKRPKLNQEADVQLDIDDDNSSNTNNNCDIYFPKEHSCSTPKGTKEQKRAQRQQETVNSSLDDSQEFVDAVETFDNDFKDELDSIDDIDIEPTSDADGETVRKVGKQLMTETTEEMPDSGDVTSDMLDNGKAIITDVKTETKLASEPEIGLDEKAVIDQELHTGDEEKEAVVAGGVNELANGDQAAEEPREEEEESESEDEVEEEEEDLVIDAQVFDNMEWEVECTAEVWKTLRDRQVVAELKRRIVHKIQLLASGDWQPHLCKRLKHVPQSMQLFEAKFSKGSRILWELAIAFSPRLSERPESRLQVGAQEQAQAVRGGRIYSDIIRVWDIVLDHDKIYRSVQKIKRSHDRGEKCIIQKRLKGLDKQPAPMSFTRRRYPQRYTEKDDNSEDVKETQQFFPPASANDTEYHILKFYSFSSVLVSHVLQNVQTKVDFPFRVTDLEHAIIHLQSKAPILLLGRSGTGKTTCCLYRLWSQFHTYWSAATASGAPMMPRGVEFVHHEAGQSGSDEEEEFDGSESSSEEDENSEAGACSSSQYDDSNLDNQTPAEAEECDHLHQMFITKNSVLCSEVQKNFRELSHAQEMLANHVQHEQDNLPMRLQDLHDHAFPLFLTSRQLLLMLDASLGPPHFFERKDDGTLKVDIAGWSDMDGPLSILPLLDEDSDEEEEGDADAEDEEETEEVGAKQRAGAKKKKVDPRREITYMVFVEEIWPKIKKGLSDVYHPSLVWMEIMSFIKGSYEALSKRCGYLTLEEYEKLGRKRAPNFSGEREVIYSCFIRYDHFKKQHLLFDETDLVHNVFCRMQQLKTQSWVIHQIFVDETQDFTQAELCLMIRLCQNPNEMFLTGDTAQSIMRGIAFRFSDLRSLFFHAKKTMQAMGKTSAVEVPKQVYQLTHNYRSHAGILALASSILELMVRFFPESFDRLQPDQGLFNGPRPILLESCSFSDLAVLLRGNKRKTSHIEFGAHQAILVVNDAARESIPEELRLGLVLTIYESKGLEFDDVLLYNFFKDSQANKEWRVVTSYLEQLTNHQQENPGETDNIENLVMIDEEVLAQKGRPRPLDFDPNQHKVLNSELKHLYTALTRARVNVWIFDEDKERRAPMFEFFKARKLVKSLTVSEINEESLSETVFAEKSSLADWLRRGEDFMKHHLYQVAAKCFGMGQNRDREKVALAHHQALMASRLKDHPRQMRAEFLVAAEMYLQCNKPSKAAVCLQNAREKELAAELFEKLGQYERAADVYRRLKQPIASSRCFEQLGNFKKAVEVLYENEEFLMAIDTLRRYNILLRDFEQKHLPIPVSLRDNGPAKFFTEEKLSHRAAELFHRNRNKRAMLEAVDRFQNVDDQVQFLECRGYIGDAANCLKTHGQQEKAAALLLKFGHLDDSVLAARETLKESVIAHYLLAECRILMTKKRAQIEIKPHLLETIKEAIQLFLTCKNNDGFGQARLLQAELTGEVMYVRQAWKAFTGSSPVLNETGLIECANWLVTNNKLEDKTVLQCVVESVGYLFKMCRLLLDKLPQASGIERLKKLDQFYGLQPCSLDKLAIHPLEKPRCLTLLKDMFKTKADRKKSYTEVQTTEVREAIVMFLLEKCREWLQRVLEGLQVMRDRERLCDYYQAGLECPNQGNSSCVCLHRPQTKDGLKKLFGIDILWAELELNVQEASVLTSKKYPTAVVNLVQSFLEEGERDLSEKFSACHLLWNDMMPAYGHCSMIGDDSRDLIIYLRSNDKLLAHFRRYLEEKWADVLKEQKGAKEDKRLKCKAVRETDVFVMFQFAYHLFGFDHGKRRMPRSPKELMTTLENELDREVQGKRKWDFQRIKYYYTLMISENKGTERLSVECIARRFFDAYELMTRSAPDPFEAVFKFNKFMQQLSMRKDVAFLPDMKTYLFWVEFYTVIAIFVIAKLKSQTFPDFVFILPSSYLQLVKFVEATFPAKSYPVLDVIDWWKPGFNFDVACAKLEERLKFYAFTVSGHGQGVHLMKEALRISLNDPNNYCLVERLMILAMVLVCNVGKALPVETEISLLLTLSRVHIPQEGPERLRKVVKMIQDSRGEADVAEALIWLMKERKNGEETLLINRWRSRMRNKVESSVLKDLSLFAEYFLNPKTIQNINIPNHEQDEASWDEMEGLNEVIEPDQTEEELQKGQADKDAELRRQKAAQIIIRFFKRVRDNRRQRSGKAEPRSPSAHTHQLFAAVNITSKWCGVCGVNFEKLLEEERNIGELGLGVPQVAEPVSPLILLKPTSPQQPKQPFTWGAAKVGTFENQEIKDKQLQMIKEKHEKEEQHQRKFTEFQRFADRYRDKIEPQLAKFKEFLDNPDFLLSNREHRERNYDLYKEEIDRMIAKCSQVERDVQKVWANRTWAHWNTIDQTIQEISTDFQMIRPHVEEVYKKLKQEEEERLNQTFASASAQSVNENIEDEDDDIEDVVKEPKVAPRHQKQRNKQRHKFKS